MKPNLQRRGRILDEIDHEKIKNALFKKALGGVSSEQVCEYSIDENGEPVLSKKKVTKKHISPDLAALKLLLEEFNCDFNVEKMTDSQLRAERSRLLQLLKEEEEDADREMHEDDEM